MYGANVGLEIGKRALMAQQLALNIAGNNIANVNTPGYTRQQAILKNSLPLQLPFGSGGTGVDIAEIRRNRSYFLDQQLRGETQKLGKWSLLSQSWTQVESIFNEPDDTGLSGQLDKFWTSWQDLANNPESQAARIAVKEQTVLLTNSFHHLSTQLNDMQVSIDNDISQTTTDVNSYASQIADLNQSIVTSELTGAKANDLRDRRDELVDELSQLVDVSTNEQNDGSVTVYMDSMALVEGNSHQNLTTTTESNGTSVVHTVRFGGVGIDLGKIGGKLEGMINTRDDVIMKKSQELDNLATGIAKAVNGIHRAGIGGNGSTNIDFFDPKMKGASDINLNSVIVDNVAYIAAGKNGQAGDNSNALDISALRNSMSMSGDKSTFGDYYNSVIGEVGTRTKEASSVEQNQQALVTQIENSRQSVGGVSLDEEMANMIQYQHAYEAAARIISTMDSTLNTIINGMGASAA
jgi:flagellar hook-associated protein 1